MIDEHGLAAQYAYEKLSSAWIYLLAGYGYEDSLPARELLQTMSRNMVGEIPTLSVIRHVDTFEVWSKYFEKLSRK